MLSMRSIVESLPRYEARLDELTRRMADPGVLANPGEIKKVGKERRHIESVVTAIRRYADASRQLEQARDLARDGTDPELVQLAQSEISSLGERIKSLEREIQLLLVPRDPNDEKNVIVEIRAGTGGEEAALFAADLLRLYVRHAERRGWASETLSLNEAAMGGVKEAIVRLSGEDVYSRLKFESGVHRVQRVPETEASGRIHTSAASVAVLPEAEEVDVHVRDEDLRIDVYRASGHGGQHVNKTESAVRITHLPTGLVVTCQDEKSQLKNRARAMTVLRARLYDLELRKQQEEIARTRRSQVSTGDRSAKIRTYNFPQGRVTDHRIGLTLYRLPEILDGDLEELSDALMLADAQERLESVSKAEG
jgi:peptide chain release factor 1